MGAGYMDLQVLVATMHQKDFSKYREMNLSSDALFANQTDFTGRETIRVGEHTAEMISTDTRGVGINRNLACLYAAGDVLLLADDDMKYVNNYKLIVLDAFRALPRADAIIFNINTIGGTVQRRQNKKIKRIHFVNAFNYGAPRIAVKRTSIKKSGILFNTNFGGGAIYSAGEDSIFISEMLKRGLKLYAYPETIASVEQTTSTWFEGYTKKYFYDKGALFKAIMKRGSWLLCLQDVIRHWHNYKGSKLSVREVLKQMRRGSRGYETLRTYEESEE